LKENYFIKNKLKKIAINKYLEKELKSAGFVDSEITKTPLATRIKIYSLKPGLVIGKKGANIRQLTANIEEKFELNKVHIEIGEVSNKNLDPKVVIEGIANDIARGISWKSTVYRALRQIKNAGAIGAEIVAKGNTAGKGQRKRKSRYYFGYLKKAGDQKNQVGFEKRTTFPGLGTIGIRLRIVQPGTVFSDKIDVLELAKEFKIKREEEILEKEETLKKDVKLKETEDKTATKDTKEEKPATAEKKVSKKATKEDKPATAEKKVAKKTTKEDKPATAEKKVAKKTTKEDKPVSTEKKVAKKATKEEKPVTTEKKVKKATKEEKPVTTEKKVKKATKEEKPVTSNKKDDSKKKEDITKEKEDTK
jgi:small subunit ribosomal protein S3